MTFTPPTTEQRFLLQHVVGLAELQQRGFPDATPDLADAIVDGAGAFAAGEFAPLNRVGDQVGAKWIAGRVTMPPGFREAYRGFVEGGWGTLAGPASHGGQGLPYALQTVVLDDLGAANLAFSLCPMLTAGAVEALDKHGSPEMQAKWLPKIVSGEWPATMNLTEPGAGSDVGALKTRAEAVGDGTYRITGTKIYITYGEHDLADNIVHLVLARLPDAPAGTRGISLFLVPKMHVGGDGDLGKANDLRCVSIEHKLGIHASPTCVMSYGDEGKCIGWLVGGENEGMRAMFTMMNNARLNVGLQGVSVAERATQGALRYANERVQSARAGSADKAAVAIIDHPDVRRMLLRMRALTMAARALVYYAAGQVDRAALGDGEAKGRLDLLTPLAKAYGTDVGVEVASLGIQVHGGMGFVEETGAAQHLRDARITPIYEGTNGIQAADLVGRKLGLDGGAVFARHLAEIAGEDGGPGLAGLIEDCRAVAEWLAKAPVDCRLAGSYPFLTMLSVATAGWLMARQRRIAGEVDGDPAFLQLKRAAADYYLHSVVGEARGLREAATAGSAVLYGLSREALAA